MKKTYFILASLIAVLAAQASFASEDEVTNREAQVVGSVIGLTKDSFGCKLTIKVEQIFSTKKSKLFIEIENEIREHRDEGVYLHNVQDRHCLVLVDINNRIAFRLTQSEDQQLSLD